MNSAAPVLVLSVHYKSKTIVDFAVFMKEVETHIYNHDGIRCTRGCIGASGIVYPVGCCTSYQFLFGLMFMILWQLHAQGSLSY